MADPEAVVTQDSSIFFPTYVADPDGTVPTGDLRATMRLTNDCLVAQMGGRRKYLLLWPDGWSTRSDDDVTVLNEEGDVVAREGEDAVFGGGERAIDDAEDLSGVEFPRSCRVGLEGAWVVSEVIDT